MTDNARPEVSVVLCTRNRADKLAATLESLIATHGKDRCEIIVVDNNSTDDTSATVQYFCERTGSIRYVKEPQVGLGAARDRGWQETTAEIVSFVDDDVHVAKDYIDRLIEVFHEHPEIGFLAGQIRLGDMTDLPLTIDLRQSAVTMPAYSFVSTTSVAGANLSFRRTCLERICGFDRDMGAGTSFPCEDLDAVTRAIWAGYPGRYDPRPIVYHYHGRKTPVDRSRLFRGYDRGRGAYYMKFILRPDTRSIYLRAYLDWLRNEARSPGDLRRLWREASAASAWWWNIHRKRTHGTGKRSDVTVKADGAAKEHA